MSFLENLGKTISGAAQTAAKKSGEMVEITKINMSIGSEEDKIEKLQMQIGKKVYENSVAGTPISADDFKDACNEITERNNTIKDLKAKILEVKSIKLCTSCGAELEKEVQFCNKCGSKQEAIAVETAQTAAEAACPKCSAALPADAGFCGSCGEKLK
ncbi:MAG: zinc ribbon domain-containing protein [Deltaproteobacteria bacterium]